MLEIGTSGGYSTLWLADAAEQTCGHLITLEIEKERWQTALKHLTATGLSDVTSTLCADVGAFLQNNQDSYDFILLDAERPAYPAYWMYLKMCLQAPGSVLVVDNVYPIPSRCRILSLWSMPTMILNRLYCPLVRGLLLAVKITTSCRLGCDILFRSTYK
ncbi:O-methyltransferase [Aggregatibacter actinomycetemcomitans]|uniref:O-methyltransferase n=1 Tax=Aggregatibacter actinomycetemcomitans TaxID=714 RepID=UPI0021CCBC8E|nr:class I SAM-dependent methyltransferase [Aggregatibacter actinomycetemcomitans]